LARFRALPRLVRAGSFVVAATVVIVVAVMIGTGGSSTRSSGATPSAGASLVPEQSTEADDSTPGPDGFRRYRVRDGDTLRTIADRFGISVRELRAANDLGDPPQLQPGVVIQVPAGG
jgi:LysM repeat protein